MIKILIADDHSLIREGFKKLIEREVGLQVVGEAENAFDVTEFLRHNQCDVIVLDINMPQKSGLELLKELKDYYPDIKVLILSMSPEDKFAIRAFRSGADGYITKDSAPEELIHAIRKIAQGGKFVTQSLAEKLAFEMGSGGEKKPHETLSDREFQVFLLIGAGKSMKEIADTLSLSMSTVNTYRRRILEKLHLHSNAEIIHYAVKNKLVE
ncbi:MAG: DNA-binding response regulator [Calditrichaeota bacterium]|nr:MAG: DNA-binding response regulator [Calditrichota bacterium]